MEEKITETRQVTIPLNDLTQWQEIVDMLAELINIPAALIMRLDTSDIEVFIASQSSGNPYHPGDREHFSNSGLYCETVIKSRDKLLIPNALADPKWQNNPDIKLNMISYLGFPIILPDGRPFGTICVLDNKENAYSETFANLLKIFRDLIQSHLELYYMNAVLGEKNRTLTDYLAEIKTLRELIPICVYCKKIKNTNGTWKPLELYLTEHSGADLSHGCCPECYAKELEALKQETRGHEK